MCHFVLRHNTSSLLPSFCFFISSFLLFLDFLSSSLLVPTLYFYADSHHDGGTCMRANARVDILKSIVETWVSSTALFLNIYQEL